MISEIIILILGIILIMDPYKKWESSVHLFQLEGYDINKYIKWLNENFNKVIGFGPLIREEKSPLVYTDRAQRLSSMHKMVNLSILSMLIIIAFFAKSPIFTIGPIVLGLLLYIFQPYILIITGKIMEPKEKRINMGFYIAAQNKIRSMENMKVVGITGSYGKTSTKFITSTILKEKFKVQDSPSSYNTPMGLSKIINNELTDDKEVFIAEMGAYVKGEIKEVADLVQPDIGILTSIGPAHLESFGSIENIVKTKYELIEALPEDGIAIFNYDDDNLKGPAEKTKLKKFYYGLEDVEKLDVYAKDISVNSRGSNFILVIKNVGEILCETKLLGRHNINNLLAGCTVGHIMGLSLEEISKGVKKIKPVENRLNLIESPNGVVVIDDGFNSNPSGAKAALEVLNEFKEGKKFIVTPGMIELGEIEYVENKKFGEHIAKVCDYAILIGKKRSIPILEGLRENNFPEEQIFIADSLAEATEIFGKIIKPGDVILFENDLPDNYSEEE